MSKYHKFFIGLLVFMGSTLALAMTTFYFAVEQINTADTAKMYESYLLDKYIPSYRQAFGKWPRNLRGVEADLSSHRDDRLMELLLAFHRDKHPAINIVKSSTSECEFFVSYEFYKGGHTVYKCTAPKKVRDVLG